MSVFSIKLKTKNGNDVKKKETVTVFWKMNFKTGLRTVAEYTFRVMYSKGVCDPKCVLSLKDSFKVKTVEDCTLRIMLNICHVISQLTKRDQIDPDFIMFISDDLYTKNQSWKYLKDIFFRPEKTKMDADELVRTIQDVYDLDWNEADCKKLGIDKANLDLLCEYSKLNPNTKFMFIDPTRDSTKYAKSLHICKMLQDRIDRNLQITDDSE